MLSINIPVYNIDARPLVLQLAKEVEKLPVNAEIRVYDDGSEETIKKMNRELKSVYSVVYTELENNLGRPAIRNKMGEDSKFSYLLFIDADSEIVSDNYLATYLNNIEDKLVLCGGTVYSPTPPKESVQFLRWYYGSKREAISAEKRNRKKGFIITSNNFCIEKKLFLKTRFRENIGSYGHEDTLLGYDLYKKGIIPFHIDNPVKHTGLENAGLFLKKTVDALENLYFISEKLLNNDPDFERQVHFLNRYKKLASIIPKMIFQKFYSVLKHRLEQNLKSKHPQLLFFDLYKLCCYAAIKNRKP